MCVRVREEVGEAWALVRRGVLCDVVAPSTSPVVKEVLHNVTSLVLLLVMYACAGQDTRKRLVLYALLWYF